jgi:RimJ/RimL family protein N-acetyltransferase
MPKVIETRRLVLSAEEDSDAEWLAVLFSQRGAEVTVRDARERIANMNLSMATLGIGALVLHVKPDGVPIGYAAVIIGRASLDEPELAFELLPHAHGHGYATEAAHALLGAVFATGRKRVWATVRTWNAASLRVLEKLGFRHDRLTTDDDGELLWLVCEPGDLESKEAST